MFAKVTFIGDYFVLSTTVEVNHAPMGDEPDSDDTLHDAIIRDAILLIYNAYGWNPEPYSTVDIEVEVDEYPPILT